MSKSKYVCACVRARVFVVQFLRHTDIVLKQMVIDGIIHIKHGAAVYLLNILYQHLTGNMYVSLTVDTVDYYPDKSLHLINMVKFVSAK